MKWKLKSLALSALARAPASTALHRLLHRVTGRFWDEITEHVLHVYGYHVRNLLTLGDPSGKSVLEFGAGRGLITSLLLSAAGARQVLAYDIVKLATVQHVNHVIRQLRDRVPAHASRPWREIANVGADLERYYGIRYCVPGDARRTGLPDGSVDLICSTSTLEHIPRQEIVDILREGRRIGTATALMSFVVDYHDHYASTDGSITRFNFYRYSDRTWRLFNPSNHFQNRLRHSDYVKLFSECGLALVEHKPIVAPEDVETLRRVPLSAAFTRYTDEDLLASNGFFVLSVAGPAKT